MVADSSAFPQYSQKEDKYEEEIKILTDKLKEVRDHVRVAQLIDWGEMWKAGDFMSSG